MANCIEACIEEACISDVDLQDGCNQMFSCSHGCQMRALGLDNETCAVNCDRNGQSGCSPEVNGYTFNLCVPCSRERCPKLPTVAECTVGCNNYGGMYHIKNFFHHMKTVFVIKKRYDRNETNLHNIFLRQASNNHDRSTATKYYLHKRSNNERYNKYWKAMNYTEIG